MTDEVKQPRTAECGECKKTALLNAFHYCVPTMRAPLRNPQWQIFRWLPQVTP